MNYSLDVLQEPRIKDVQPILPENWQVSLESLFSLHFKSGYFKAVIALSDGKPVGYANTFCFGESGWLGNIAVLESSRNRGIGTALTKKCMDILAGQGCQQFCLFATPMGRPVYERLGFRVNGYYIFLSADKGDFKIPPEVKKAGPEDHDHIREMDAYITGETRQQFLSRYMEGACITHDRKGRATGYYLPALGTGAIGALHAEAGELLLEAMWAQKEAFAIIPEENEKALAYAERRGFKEVLRSPLMKAGALAGERKSEMIFNRGTGYSG